MEAFAKAGVSPKVDEMVLADGRLELTFDWPLGDRMIPLHAIYPDGYPEARPHINLTDPALFPGRHCSPLDGNLCLLGRDTRQWQPDWTVPELLKKQLQKAMEAGGEEDPQGEPAEVWWNTLAPPESYCLIDSDWSLLDAKGPGILRIVYVSHADNDSGLPVLRALVERVFDAEGKEIATWKGPMPSALRGTVRKMDIAWVRSPKQLMPPRIVDQGSGLGEFMNGRFDLTQAFDVAPGVRGQLVATLYPTETEFRKHDGETWLFVLVHGKLAAFYPRKKALPRGKKAPETFSLVIRTLRAGTSDIISRAPAAAALATKSVALLGTGAIGAPLAIELARNGIRKLTLMDYDIVEPGNTVRWPLGSSAWGLPKGQALADFIEREYPATEVSYIPHCIGTYSPQTCMGDDTALDKALEGVDLAIDATAAYGPTTLIQGFARSRSLPLLTLFGSPTLGGGAVVLSVPDSGCYVCLECAWKDEPNVIPAPLGMFDEGELIQPPGCAERTFSGTFCDLQELSLQAMRVVIGLFGRNNIPSSSVVYTLSFRDEDGVRVPAWRTDALPRNPKCSCTW
ncbi:ThiF family adenylyltransferase [Bradyrhizobium tropiciagri]|uniref:ThiF family adenylyltransferase n=1 Tax=Bradyrhizobium tropiciagri TaxID=312253 RepID=UPI00138F8BAC|nr:ThiF family adenylyltransferase [Bradyrhizobium tropiciagri]